MPRNRTSSIRTLLLPNREHPYGDSLQTALERSGVTAMKCNAAWGFDLCKNVDLVTRLNPDILHLQWPESLCRMNEEDDVDTVLTSIRSALDELAGKGRRIVWTMHNLQPHIQQKPELQKKVYGHFAAHADGVIHHSHCGKAKALDTYLFREETRHVVHRHGYFIRGARCLLSQEEARRHLGLSAHSTIYLFCGAFRPDKNMDVLVRAVGERGPVFKNQLIMVGQEQRMAAALYPGLDLGAPNIVWPGRLSFDDLSVYMKAADALISAHGDRHLTSAGPHLSQSYSKTQVCLRCDYNQEVLGESAFYFDAGDEAVEALKARLSELTRPMLRDASRRVAEGREEYDWARIGAKTRIFYEELLYGATT